MNSLSMDIATWSYGIAAVAFLAFALQLRLGWQGNLRGWLVFAAVVSSACWAGAVTGFLASRIIGFWVAAGLFDAVRLGAWFAFAVSTIYVPDLRPQASPSSRIAQVPKSAYGVAALILAYAVMQVVGGLATQQLDLPGRAQFALPLAAAILGLVLVEQSYRNVPQHARWGMKPLCLGLGGVFGFDLYLYADAFLFSRLNVDAWVARALVHTFVIPFVAVSAARNREWSFEISISRHVVFHSTALLTSGLYLLLMAAAGYYLRFFGGSWGRALEITFFFAALLGLAVLLVSGSLRAKLRVFLNKHFFSYRYDYREEWLRFTQSMSSRDAHPGIRVLAIKALADLVESPAGYLWLHNPQSSHYVPAARWNVPERTEVEPSDASLPSFLKESHWVVDLNDWRADPDKYEGLVAPAWLLAIPDAWLVVPLMQAEGLLGFVVLNTPRAKIDVNWEVTDLLKTAGRQAASFLGQMQAMEALLEARKFDAFNRMSAFVVHDLKNLVSQLSLLLKNAERHHNNPEFRKDMLATIDNVVERMKNLLMQLRAGTTPVDKPKPVDLSAVIREIQHAKASQSPALEVKAETEVQTLGHADRLGRVVGHLVQNALDATDRSGRVWVRLWRENDTAVVEIGDTGQGMSPEFVRERLFKPFQSTKAAGMGIGAYESSQYIEELGGKIAVESRQRVGTTIRVTLPLHRPAAIAVEPRREVA